MFHAGGLGGLLRQHALDQIAERLGNARLVILDRKRIEGGEFRHHRREGGFRKRERPGHHAVHHAAQAEEITAWIDRTVAGLLGRHGVRRAHDIAGRQSLGDLTAPSQDLVEPRLALREAILQGFAFQQFHGEVRQAVDLPDLVDGGDVVARQPGGGLGLEEHSLLGERDGDLLHHLDRHGPLQHRVDASVHHPHAALPKELDNAVMLDAAQIAV